MEKKPEHQIDSPLLQMLVQVGDDMGTLRNAVLTCACKHHRIADSECYINEAAVIRYIQGKRAQDDMCVVELYCREEHEADMGGPVITPKYIVYSQRYVLTTPAHVIQKYLKNHYKVGNQCMYYRIYAKK